MNVVSYNFCAGNELMDNIFGALVVRRSDRAEIIRELYDEDRLEHIFLISEWKTPGSSSLIPPNILINGIGSNMVSV